MTKLSILGEATVGLLGSDWFWHRANSLHSLRLAWGRVHSMPSIDCIFACSIHILHCIMWNEQSIVQLLPVAYQLQFKSIAKSPNFECQYIMCTRHGGWKKQVCRSHSKLLLVVDASDTGITEILIVASLLMHLSPAVQAHHHCYHALVMATWWEITALNAWSYVKLWDFEDIYRILAVIHSHSVYSASPCLGHLSLRKLV